MSCLTCNWSMRILLWVLAVLDGVAVVGASEDVVGDCCAVEFFCNFSCRSLGACCSMAVGSSCFSVVVCCSMAVGSSCCFLEACCSLAVDSSCRSMAACCSLAVGSSCRTTGGMLLPGRGLFLPLHGGVLFHGQLAVGFVLGLVPSPSD